MEDHGTKRVASAAISLALTATREEEKKLEEQLLSQGIKGAAVDYGGEFISSFTKMIERTIVAAKRQGLIGDSHAEEGAVAGAAREALSGVLSKAIGLNVGGKIAVARYQDNISVAAFFAVGLLHLNEVAIGLGHRVA